MKSLRSILLGTAAAASLLATATAPASAAPAVGTHYQHVLLISIDGMHAIDLQRMITKNPASALAQLSNHGIVYRKAMTTGPSDSFPGMLAQVTGATSKSTGLYYDDSYDRAAYPADSNCIGAPGAEIQNFESIDWNLDDVTAGGTLGQPLSQINPANLQMALVGGVCQVMYPHNYLRVNTLFEVLHGAGKLTAWSDKHPAYEVLSGPSGTGLVDLFTPEINSQMFLAGAPVGDDNTKSFAAVRAYDQIKVNAVLNWIDGWNSTHTAQPGVPAIFGMNFQSVSVGQKLKKAGYGDDPSLLGGYVNANGKPANGLDAQLQYVDSAIGSMVTELTAQGLIDSTLIIVSAKHGQSPIDKSLRVAVDDAPFTGTPGYAFHIADDIGLVWLTPDAQKSSHAAARSYLTANSAALHLRRIEGRDSIANTYQDPYSDSRAPDFIAIPDHGVIYTGGSKIAEHGGLTNDDRNVALLVSAPDIAGETVHTVVTTTQIAPTILTALGMDPNALQGVVLEGTQVLSK